MIEDEYIQIGSTVKLMLDIGQPKITVQLALQITRYVCISMRIEENCSYLIHAVNWLRYIQYLHSF